MKRQIDLDKAAEAEAFGVLAVRKAGRRRTSRKARINYSRAQKRTLGEFANLLLEFAKQAGAKRHAVKAGNISFKVQGQGAKEILSVQKLIGV